MSFCPKCGTEVANNIQFCPSCGGALSLETKTPSSSPSPLQNPTPSYEKTVANASMCNIIGIVLLVIAILVGLFLHTLVGAIIALAAELVVLIPNTKLQKEFKRNNQPITDKKKYSAALKAVKADLKRKNGAFKLSFILAIPALLCVIIFALF